MDERSFECQARKQSLPEPADCNWPYCGCDEKACNVVEALQEHGWLPPVPGLRLDYDSATDTLTIAGVKYTAGIFRDLGGLEPNRWLKIVKREDGVLTIYGAPKGARIAWEAPVSASEKP